MITIIDQKLTNSFHPVNNPINMTFNSNNSGKCSFRYICDIYVNGVKVFRDKLFPDPSTGYGFFQLNYILSDYIENLIPKQQEDLVLNVASSATTTRSVNSVYVIVGEEYDSTSNCSGAVAQYLGLSTSNVFNVFNGVLDYEDFLSFDYTKYLTGYDPTVTALFLTNSPKDIEVGFNEPHYLEFMSLVSPTASYVRIETTDKDGLSNRIDLPVSPTTLLRKRYRIGVGPSDINRITQASTISDTIIKYTVQLMKDDSVDYPLTETFNFKVIRPNCFQKRFGFIGRLGSIESFTFYHRDTKSYNIERKTYKKLLQSNYSGKLTYEVGDRSQSTYGMKVSETHKVGTFCSKDNSSWLSEMWLSPNVWLYDLPKLIQFTTTLSGSEFTLHLESNHGLQVADEILLFTEWTSTSEYKRPNKFTVQSVDDRSININMTNVSGDKFYSGWIQPFKKWRMLPVMISDATIEDKQKLTKPIEYNLNYTMAFDKLITK